MSAPHPVHSSAVPSNPAAAIPASGAPTTTPSPQGAEGAPKKAPQHKDKKPKKAGDLSAGMAALELNPAPDFIASRIELFEQLKKEADEKLASASRSPSSRRPRVSVLAPLRGERCTPQELTS